MRHLAEDYKLLRLLAAQAITSTTTGSAVNVESYDDDALVVADLGAYTSTPSIVITLTGAKTGTPTTYDQTLATFTAATATGVGAVAANLAGIANVKGVATLSGGSSPSVPVSLNLLVKPFVKTGSNNSSTIA